MCGTQESGELIASTVRQVRFLNFQIKWDHNSAVEFLPYKQAVTGSNPVGPIALAVGTVT